ncbi:hypothetical protein L2E82_21727 [Cichorium intybus]|uniref:Uncharacterized protein n=1 Tax=Cichorium intybus TaxID=13427 RepID=A0ACB9DX09_CICIN|nr:hypothetical protein L2E82_21727 [Cichorium intybus]
MEPALRFTSRVKKISVIRNLCLVELLQKGKPVIPYDVKEKTGSETEETEVKLVEEEEDGGTSESGAQLAMGEAFGVEAPAQKLDVYIATRICISDDGPDRTLLSVETADRPRLLVDLVKIFTDINVAVESGEFGTKGKNTQRKKGHDSEKKINVQVDPPIEKENQKLSDHHDEEVVAI